MDAPEVALRFVEAINRADVDALAALMTDDHVFVDSDGSKFIGRAAVVDAWAQYFSLMRGYRAAVLETLGSGDTVVLIGTASGEWRRQPGTAWAVPAAWRAVVDGRRVAVWQVFVNPEPILAAGRRKPSDSG